MGARHSGGGDAGREPKLFIRVIHDGTDAASQRATQIQRDLRFNRSASAAMEATVGRADTGQVAGLRAKTRQDADVWILLSDVPLGSAPTELLLVPVSGDLDPNAPIGQFVRKLALRDIQTANQQRFPAFQYLRANNIPFVLLNEIPWDAPPPFQPMLRPGNRQPFGDEPEVLEERVRAVLKEYEDLKQALTEDSEKLPSNVRDRLLDHFRERLAEIEECSVDIIPSELKLLIDDSEVRQFVLSALCVERLARRHIPPNDFDFALPGSGLWKAFERALNLSVVAALRREAGIVSSDPLSATGPNGTSRKPVLVVTDLKVLDGDGDPRGIDLNRRQHGNKSTLEGVSLGQVKWLLESAWNNAPSGTRKTYVSVRPIITARLAHNAGSVSLCTYVVGNEPGASPCTSGLIEALKKVHALRNPPSHISPMKETEYKQLSEILLDHGHLAKVLQLVQMLGVPAASDGVSEE